MLAKIFKLLWRFGPELLEAAYDVIKAASEGDSTEVKRRAEKLAWRAAFEATIRGGR